MPDTVPKHILKIPHKLSKQFSSYVATGSILGGPSPNGLYHFIFYLDSMWIESETGTPVAPVSGSDESQRYEVKLEKGDIRNFREDQARISMPEEAAKALYRLLQEKFEPEKNPKNDDPKQPG